MPDKQIPRDIDIYNGKNGQPQNGNTVRSRIPNQPPVTRPLEPQPMGMGNTPQRRIPSQAPENRPSTSPNTTNNVNE